MSRVPRGTFVTTPPTKESSPSVAAVVAGLFVVATDEIGTGEDISVDAARAGDTAGTEAAAGSDVFAATDTGADADAEACWPVALTLFAFLAALATRSASFRAFLAACLAANVAGSDTSSLFAQSIPP